MRKGCRRSQEVKGWWSRIWRKQGGEFASSLLIFLLTNPKAVFDRGVRRRENNAGGEVGVSAGNITRRKGQGSGQGRRHWVTLLWAWEWGQLEALKCLLPRSAEEGVSRGPGTNLNNLPTEKQKRTRLIGCCFQELWDIDRRKLDKSQDHLKQGNNADTSNWRDTLLEVALIWIFHYNYLIISLKLT